MYHTMKIYEEDEIQFHAFLTSTLGGDEWLASRTGCCNPREGAPRMDGVHVTSH
jgi:hypothetical protein